MKIIESVATTPAFYLGLSTINGCILSGITEPLSKIRRSHTKFHATQKRGGRSIMQRFSGLTKKFVLLNVARSNYGVIST